MSYGVNIIAKILINESISIKHPISNLKLQKLLYYVQAAFLVETYTPAFQEPINAWRYGPVVEDVYFKYRIYADADIKKLEEIPKGTMMRQDDFERIKKVVHSYQNYNGYDLIAKTHNEDPWRRNRPQDRYESVIINQDEIKRYYTENKELIYGQD